MNFRRFWFISLCVLLIAAIRCGLNMPIRIALGANAIVIVIDIIKKVRAFYGRDEA